jgi:predicted site-specific integrase-resolvase
MREVSEMNRTAIYARTAIRNETALNWQVQVLQGLAANLSLNVTHIIREAASGLDFKRRGLNELMGLIEHHEIDTVLMTNLSRIGRDTLKVLAILEELESHGVKLIIQGGDTVETSNPLLALLHRFTPHPGLEVVLASTTE